MDALPPLRAPGDNDPTHMPAHAYL
jgi:hypothetical protein